MQGPIAGASGCEQRIPWLIPATKDAASELARKDDVGVAWVGLLSLDNRRHLTNEWQGMPAFGLVAGGWDGPDIPFDLRPSHPGNLTPPTCQQGKLCRRCCLRDAARSPLARRR